MKIFKLLAVAFVAMLSFSSCDQHECEDFDYDHSADLIGTWTCLQENFAEALVISADGSVTSTGVAFGEYWENVEGKIEIKNGKATMTFEDHDNYEGHFDIIPGVAFSIYNDKERRFTYNYCKEDLSDEIVGMWVCTEEVFGQEEESVGINTYTENGKSYLTAFLPDAGGYVNQLESNYKVVGDLLIGWMNDGSGMPALYQAFGLNIIPNGTEMGDIMTVYNPVYGTNPSFLRINEGLSFNAKPYAYNTAYISNVKGGKDEEFSILGHPFNMANVKAGDFDMLFHSELFCVDLKENHIKQLFRSNGQDIAIDIPITVEGNKVTLHMGTEDTKLQDVEMYMFQDADACQLHMYMHTDAFINYFANMEVISLQVEGKIGSTQAEIDAVYANMKARIEAINVSFVFKAIK